MLKASMFEKYYSRLAEPRACGQCETAMAVRVCPPRFDSIKNPVPGTPDESLAVTEQVGVKFKGLKLCSKRLNFFFRTSVATAALPLVRPGIVREGLEHKNQRRKKVPLSKENLFAVRLSSLGECTRFVLRESGGWLSRS